MRHNYRTLFPPGVKALSALEAAVRESPLEPELLELVKVRASQINECAYCLAMHLRDARAKGESQVRLDVVAAWRETPFFTARERAALAWCESLTEMVHADATSSEHDALEGVFSPEEIVALTFAVVAINGWNRIAIGLGAEVTSLEDIDFPTLNASETHTGGGVT
jgi:AhpD family alkylhydroperoxidase